MKLKGDFVTNSSSTSFILKGIGKTNIFTDEEIDLPTYISAIMEDNLEFKGFSSFLSIKQNDIEFEGFIRNPDDKEYTLEDRERCKTIKCSECGECGSYKVSLKKDGVKIEIVYEGLSPLISSPKTELPYYAFKLFMTKLLENFDSEKILVFYNQEVIETNGDGWNGGDPMGYYAYIADCKTAEEISKREVWKTDGVELTVHGIKETKSLNRGDNSTFNINLYLSPAFGKGGL